MKLMSAPVSPPSQDPVIWSSMSTAEVKEIVDSNEAQIQVYEDRIDRNRQEIIHTGRQSKTNERISLGGIGIFAVCGGLSMVVSCLPLAIVGFAGIGVYAASMIRHSGLSEKDNRLTQQGSEWRHQKQLSEIWQKAAAGEYEKRLAAEREVREMARGLSTDRKVPGIINEEGAPVEIDEVNLEEDWLIIGNFRLPVNGKGEER